MAASTSFLRNYAQSSMISVVVGAFVSLAFGSLYAKLNVLPDLGLNPGKHVVLWQLAAATILLGLILSLIGELLKWSWYTALVYVACGPWWILASQAALSHGLLSGSAWLSLPVLHGLATTIMVKLVIRRTYWRFTSHADRSR